jgi:hypothetical protein
MSRNHRQAKLKLACVYCSRHRNDESCRSHTDEFEELMQEELDSHGLCPECLREYFPDMYAAIMKEGKVTEKVASDNRVFFGRFFIVTNMGYLYGDYNKEQRL